MPSMRMLFLSIRIKI